MAFYCLPHNRTFKFTVMSLPLYFCRAIMTAVPRSRIMGHVTHAHELCHKYDSRTCATCPTGNHPCDMTYSNVCAMTHSCVRHGVVTVARHPTCYSLGCAASEGSRSEFREREKSTYYTRTHVHAHMCTHTHTLTHTTLEGSTSDSRERDRERETETETHRETSTYTRTRAHTCTHVHTHAHTHTHTASEGSSPTPP